MPARSQTAVIIIPTYNEVANIGPLIDELCSRTFPVITDWNIQLLVVDGKSTDCTADAVKEKQKSFQCLHLFEETARHGLGAAYLEGFKYAMNTLHADVVVEFDGDFQHPPDVIRELLGKIGEGFDYVAGSRNIPGGSEAERSMFRHILTKFGGFLARFILFFPYATFWQVTDATTGLKATRVKGFVDRLNLNPEHLKSKKFGYKVQFLSETLALKARYAEIPLQFQNRAAGKSKFEMSTIADILMACIRTRLNL
jgi:dolichol-phosphate mannosyltransferase